MWKCTWAALAGYSHIDGTHCREIRVVIYICYLDLYPLCRLIARIGHSSPSSYHLFLIILVLWIIVRFITLPIILCSFLWLLRELFRFYELITSHHRWFRAVFRVIVGFRRRSRTVLLRLWGYACSWGRWGRGLCLRERLDIRCTSVCRVEHRWSRCRRWGFWSLGRFWSCCDKNRAHLLFRWVAIWDFRASGWASRFLGSRLRCTSYECAACSEIPLSWRG